jgi:hypothetical protein
MHYSPATTCIVNIITLLLQPQVWWMVWQSGRHNTWPRPACLGSSLQGGGACGVSYVAELSNKGPDSPQMRLFQVSAQLALQMCSGCSKCICRVLKGRGGGVSKALTIDANLDIVRSNNNMEMIGPRYKLSSHRQNNRSKQQSVLSTAGTKAPEKGWAARQTRIPHTQDTKWCRQQIFSDAVNC